MNKDLREQIFQTILHDKRFETIAAEFIEHKQKLGIEATPMQRTMIANAFRQACLAFLSKDTGADAERYRADADTLDSALCILQADAEFFRGMMAMRDCDACGRVALAAIEHMAGTYRAMAETHARDARNKTFFYMLGRLWAGATHAGDALPLPTARQALAVYQVLVDAIRAESPALLQGMKTDYDANDGAAEIRRLMKSGRAAGGTNTHRK